MRQHLFPTFSALILLLSIAPACGDDPEEGEVVENAGDMVTGDGMNSANSGDGDAAQGANDGDGAQAGAGSMDDGTQAGDGVCKTEADVSSPSMSASEACATFCVEEEACRANTTAEDCMLYRRCAEEDQGEAVCVSAALAYWDCLRAQTNICEPEACCEMQAINVQTACAQ